MANRPYFWKARNCWYVKNSANSQNIRLDPDKDEAMKMWHEMELARRVVGPAMRVDVLAENFLDRAAGEVEPGTYRNYESAIALFCAALGARAVDSLKPFDVNQWLAGQKTWGSAGRRTAITGIKRMFNWAVAEGLIPSSPIAAVKKPAAQRRDALVSREQHVRICSVRPDVDRWLARRDGCFRAFLVALWLSGARPDSVATVAADSVSPDGARWVIQKHKTRRQTGRPLVVYLSPCLQTLTRIAMFHRPMGPLFSNSRGKAWKKDSIKCRFTQLRKRIDGIEGVSAYTYRHTYITNGLLAGVDIATMAELAGHKGTRMIDEHYGHLARHNAHLSDAAKKIAEKSQPDR